MNEIKIQQINVPEGAIPIFIVPGITSLETYDAYVEYFKEMLGDRRFVLCGNEVKVQFIIDPTDEITQPFYLDLMEERKK